MHRKCETGTTIDEQRQKIQIQKPKVGTNYTRKAAEKNIDKKRNIKHEIYIKT